MSDDHLNSSGTAPVGDGWSLWASAAQPDLRIWVNEPQRQILFADAQGERRINAPNDTAFALELADVERFYGAAPLPGGRDSAAILAQPSAERASVSLAARVWTLAQPLVIILAIQAPSQEEVALGRAPHRGSAVRRHVLRCRYGPDAAGPHCHGRIRLPRNVRSRLGGAAARIYLGVRSAARRHLKRRDAKC